MQISGTSPDNVLPQPLPVVTREPNPGKHALREFFVDEFKPATCRQIASSLSNREEVNPEVIAKAKELLTDPSFPSEAQLTMLARMIVGDKTPLPPEVPPINRTPLPPEIQPPTPAVSDNEAA